MFQAKQCILGACMLVGFCNVSQAFLFLHSFFTSGVNWPCEFSCFLSILLQDPSVNLPNNGDVLVLSSVTRRDSGIYQCRPLEADSLPDVKGEMQLTVHCEEPSLKHNRVRLTSDNANMLTC